MCNFKCNNSDMVHTVPTFYPIIFAIHIYHLSATVCKIIAVKIVKICYFRCHNSDMVRWNFLKIAWQIDLHLLIIFTQVRFSLSVLVFELFAKNYCLTPCSIFSHGSHVGWSAETSNTILKVDTLRMIVAKFGSNCPSSFRGEDFWKSLRRRWRWRQTDDDDDGRQVMAKAHMAF